MEVLIVIWLGCGLAAALAAEGKGRSGCGGLLLGALLGPIGLAIVLLMGKTAEKAKEQEARSADRRPCPACRESVAYDARVCPHCRTEFADSHVQRAVAEREEQRNANIRNFIIVGGVILALAALASI